MNDTDNDFSVMTPELIDKTAIQDHFYPVDNDSPVILSIKNHKWEDMTLNFWVTNNNRDEWYSYIELWLRFQGIS